MERVKGLGVKKGVELCASVGATVNKASPGSGSGFHCSGFRYAMDFSQLTIVLTATLASIGSAAVPGAGMVMLVIVLGNWRAGQGLALIFAVDRLLDMCEPR